MRSCWLPSRLGAEPGPPGLGLHGLAFLGLHGLPAAGPLGEIHVGALVRIRIGFLGGSLLSLQEKYTPNPIPIFKAPILSSTGDPKCL